MQIFGVDHPQFHKSNIIVIGEDFLRSWKNPYVLIFDAADGKEIRRFEITMGEHDKLHSNLFTIIENNIFLSIEKSKSAESDAYDSVIVYDLQGKFTNQWQTKFSSINDMISRNGRILLTTRKELYVQVFNQYGEFSHKFGDYELCGEHTRCSILEWTDGRVIISYQGTHRLYNIKGELLQVLTFADFGFSSVNNNISETCVTQWGDILIFVQIRHMPLYEVFVFKHVLSKVELQRTFLIEITLKQSCIKSAFSFPNGSICIFYKDLTMHVYK